MRRLMFKQPARRHNRWCSHCATGAPDFIPPDLQKVVRATRPSRRKAGGVCLSDLAFCGLPRPEWLDEQVAAAHYVRRRSDASYFFLAGFAAGSTVIATASV